MQKTDDRQILEKGSKLCETDLNETRQQISTDINDRNPDPGHDPDHPQN